MSRGGSGVDRARKYITIIIIATLLIAIAAAALLILAATGMFPKRTTHQLGASLPATAESDSVDISSLYVNETAIYGDDIKQREHQIRENKKKKKKKGNMDKQEKRGR